MLIYKITNVVNGKSYVGQTSKTAEERLLAHKKKATAKVNRYLYDAMNHYGVDKFTVEVLEDNITGDIHERERYWITKENTFTPNGYNMTLGGGGGNTVASWSEEDRKALYQRQGQSRTGKKRSIEMCEALSKLHKGKTISANQREKISQTLTRKFASGELAKNTPVPKYGVEHHNYVPIDTKDVHKLILDRWKARDIAAKYSCTAATLVTRLKNTFGKTYVEPRKERGIKGYRKELC